MFFACAILVFGVTLIGVNIYRINKRMAEQERLEKIHLAVTEIDGSVRIAGEYEAGISKITYYWNEEEKIEEMGNGRNKIEKLIDLPQGNNTLTVEIVGTDGEKKEFKENFGGSIILISVVEDEFKLKIVASNEKGLQNIKYKWNLDDEVEVLPSAEDPNSVEVVLDIDRLEIGRGNNEITVKALDKENKTTTETMVIKGQHEPKIDWIQKGNVVECTMTHDMGFEKIEFVINGRALVYDKNVASYNEALTTIVMPIPLQEGENTIIIKAYSREGTVLERVGGVTYTP